MDRRKTSVPGLHGADMQMSKQVERRGKTCKQVAAQGDLYLPMTPSVSTGTCNIKDTRHEMHATIQ